MKILNTFKIINFQKFWFKKIYLNCKYKLFSKLLLFIKIKIKYFLGIVLNYKNKKTFSNINENS